MIDIHCHILPGVDDGPRDLAGALAMARLAATDGTRTLVATPHVDACGLDSEQIRARVAELQDALDAENNPLRLLAGADGASHVGAEVLARYPIADGPYLLLEFPHTHLPLFAQDLVFDLVTRNRVPIITHPERNPSVVREPQLLEPLVGAGALVQLTAGSLAGEFGREARACARHLLRRGLCHFLASDGHGTDWRPPLLSRGLKAAVKLIGSEAAERLVRENPARVVAGTPWEG